MSLTGLLAGALLVGVGLAAWLLWRQHRQHARARVVADEALAVSREAAARQLIELRTELQAVRAELAQMPALRAEVARLRAKYRRLYGHYRALAAQHLDATAARDAAHPLGPDSDIGRDLP
jgi:uncharacterized membrane protein